MFQEMLFLAERGVPWDVMQAWSANRRKAAVVALVEMRGGVFSWETMSWVQKAGE